MGKDATVELSSEQQLMVKAMVLAIKDELKHECFFNPKERKPLHDFVDAIEETKATRGTHILILSAGMAWRDVTKKLTSFVMWSIIIAAAVLVSVFAGKPLLNLLNK